MTPAPSENLGTGRLRREQAPVPLCPRNGKRPRTVQGTCDDTSTGPHEDPLTASSGRPSDEGATGHSPGV